MKPSEVEAIAISLFGKGWKKELPVALGLNFTTLWRQLNENRVSGPVESTLRAWKLIHETQGLIPPVEPGKPFRQTPASKKPPKLTSYAKAMLDD